MNKLLFLLAFPVVTFAQSGQQEANRGRFLINGNVSGLPDSTWVLYNRAGDASQVVASTYSKNGKFTLFGNVSEADLYELTFIGKKDVLDIFAGNETIAITGDAKNIKNLKVTGASYNNDFVLYNSRFNVLKTKLNNLVAQANKAQGSDRDALVQKIEAVKLQVLKEVDRFVKEKPSSPVTSFLVYVTSPIESNFTKIEERFNKLKSTAKKGFYAGELEKMIAQSKVGTIGTLAIDFTQNDTANNPVKLSSFKGKYVLVDFWASWCGPCRMENPNVVEVYNQYKDKNFTVLGVSLDMNKDKWIQAIKADNLAWTHVSDLKYWQNEVAKLYHIQSIPANMLIDPNGKIIARDLRGEALHATLKDLLQ